MKNDVALWFAKDSSDKIVLINEVDKNQDKYCCPLCNSEVIPKATNSTLISAHFAHIDKSKCTAESMYHWWYKNHFIQTGDVFTIIADKTYNYVCQEVIIEKSYHTTFGIYKPDVTIITQCGKTIYFEYNYTNKKDTKDYINKWMELKNIVVEINIKSLFNANYGINTYTFKALYYNGKCFNISKKDIYYHTVGVIKEYYYNDYDKDAISQLDYIWELISQYKTNQITKPIMLEQLLNHNCIFNETIEKVLSNSKCTDILYDLYQYFIDTVFDDIHMLYGLDFANMRDQFRINIAYKNRYSDANINFECYNVEERCWYVSTLRYYKCKQDVIDYIIKSYNENIITLNWNECCNKNNQTLKEIKEHFLQNNSLYIPNIYRDDFSLDVEFISDCKSNPILNQILVFLKFNKSPYHESEIYTKIKIDDINNFDENRYLLEINNVLKKYYYNLKPYSDEEINNFDSLIELIRNHYDSTKLSCKVNGRIIHPDMYEIYVTYYYTQQHNGAKNRKWFSKDYIIESYRIKNNYVMNSGYPDSLMVEYYNINEIKSIITLDMSNRIRELKSKNIIIDKKYIEEVQDY